MRKLALLVGEPAAGKTRIARELIRWLEETNGKVHQHKFKEVYATLYFPAMVGVVGTYTGEPFDGTDKLALHTQPQMLELLEELPSWAWFLEGDRYSTPSFAEKARTLGETHVISLLVPEPLLVSRRLARGSDQNKTWLAGRHTKWLNMTAHYATERFPHINDSDTERVVYFLRSLFSNQPMVGQNPEVSAG